MENSGGSELLLSLVGHEVGNALTIIKGYLTVAKFIYLLYTISIFFNLLMSS